MKYFLVKLIVLNSLGVNSLALWLSYIMFHFFSFLMKTPIICFSRHMFEEFISKNLRYEVDHNNYFSSSININLIND